MSSAERAGSGIEDKSLWRKSTAVKLGAGMMVVGAFYGLAVAAVGLGVVAGSWFWHRRGK